MASRKEREFEKEAARVERAFLSPPCAYCTQPSQGNYSIHRDGFGEGPDVPLCDSCGEGQWPTEEEIWSTVGQAENCIKCEEEIRPDDQRKGSFHAWCYDN
jgi:hypothetical protein